MSVAEKSRVDYGACENKLRDVLRLSEEQGDNMLADYVSTTAKAELVLKPPKACYETTNHKGEVVAKRKPCWGQWATTTSATATRRGGGNGIPMCDKDFEKAAYVHAINALPAPYPDMLRGRFAPNPTISEKAAAIYPVLKLYRTSETVLMAKDMLDHIYFPRQVREEKREGDKLLITPRNQKIWERYNYSSEAWMDSAERKAWDRLKRRLREHLQPAIEAWANECERMGLGIGS